MDAGLFTILVTAALTGAPLLAVIAWRKAPSERSATVVSTIATVNEDLRKQLALRDEEVARAHKQLREQAAEAQREAARIRDEARAKIEGLQQRVAVLEAMYEEVVRREAERDKREERRELREVRGEARDKRGEERAVRREERETDA
jgi:phage I-like protein